MVEDNSKMVEHREQAIKNVSKSIVDLNMIFKDLATMVVDQVGRLPLSYFYSAAVHYTVISIPRETCKSILFSISHSLLQHFTTLNNNK